METIDTTKIRAIFYPRSEDDELDNESNNDSREGDKNKEETDAKSMS